MTASIPAVTLRTGHEIPQIGLGVYKVPDDEACDVVLTALECGYRHIDTATLYANESGVGEGIRRSGIARDDLFVTTKVWDADHGFDKTLRAFDESARLLGLDYVDLYLIHWPVPSRNLYVETWRALERLHREGRVRSIGVSNFHPHHLERLMGESDTAPAVNQIELHPWLPQRDVRAYNSRHGIATEAWSPFARGRILDDPLLSALARTYAVTPAQILVRWHLQLGNIVIPKSVTPSRIRSNIDVAGFELGAEDLEAIGRLESGERTGQDPDVHGQ
ncbi:aldo/keto reductase [Paramicrobacterium agarici]|uniref:Diketogulonate reductase-like aldo/keto reductase n=1 Tax=Paramicrobacterium agarici TaxID=630514 RepID=A0A2A9DX29_9MICO|nr:aldo/keto reductase [Microbacterium agarici]PFG30901.1 diketogulonate reductase-like aldo/keto reductase [Microbacterium agarici]